MNPRLRILLATALLPLIAAGFLYFAARGAFLRATNAPLAFAFGFSLLSALSLLWRPKTEFRGRLTLVLLAASLAGGSALAHRHYLEGEYRAVEEPTRAELVGRTAPRLAYRHAVNLSPEIEPTVQALSGKLILIDFWATWCDPCVRTMPAFDRLQRRYPDRLLVVGVTKFYDSDGRSPESAAELAQIKEFVRTRDVHYPILVADSDANLANYKINFLPTVVIIEPGGRVSNYWVAERGTEEAARHIESLLAR